MSIFVSDFSINVQYRIVIRSVVLSSRKTQKLSKGYRSYRLPRKSSIECAPTMKDFLKDTCTISDIRITDPLPFHACIFFFAVSP